jgi:hypothetical protein
LAKLVVSAAMTYGHTVLDQAAAALDAYNKQLRPALRCGDDEFTAYADTHHRLTAKYLHRNGYRYRWPDLLDGSPWR